jgi:acylphosphatase
MRLHVVVRGRVQGVGFRWFVRETARHLDIAGWVKNLADGSVEVAADGPETAVARLRAELQRGPEGASVESVDALSEDNDALPKPFSILR